jgi:hypothetical protein
MMHRLIRSSLIIAGLCVTLGACDQAIEEDMNPSETPTIETNEQEPVHIDVESLWDKTPTLIGTEIDSGALTIGGPALPVTSPTSDTAQVSGDATTTQRQQSPLIKTGAMTDGMVGASDSGSADELQYDVNGLHSAPMQDPSGAPCMDEDCDGSAGLA